MRLDEETIVVVEDNAFMRQLLADTLVVNGAREDKIHSFANGAEAHAFLLEGGCTDAVVICDIAMPGVSGLELYAKTRTQLPGLRFIFITALRLNSADRLLIKGAGLPVLTKPFSSVELLESIEKVSGQKEAF